MILVLCNVTTGYKREMWLDVNTGVLQGSVTSLLLSIACRDTAIKTFTRDRTRQGAGHIMVHSDDTVYWSESKRELEEALTFWSDCLKQAGKVNVKKRNIQHMQKR